MKSLTTTKTLIHYVGFYSVNNSVKTERYSISSAVNKMNYIAQTAIRLGFNVEIISSSWVTKKNKKKYYRKKTEYNDIGLLVDYPPSFTPKNKALLFLSQIISLSWLCYRLIRTTKQNSIVLLYHSSFLFIPILIAKKIRNFKLIIEVEEIYHLFTKSNKRVEKRLLSLADGYIFSSKGIIEYLNNNIYSKKHIILNGEYRFINVVKKENFNKDKITKVVYAGHIDLKRRGAFNAVYCSKYLSKKYLIYIIGFGKQNDIIKLTNEIKKINQEFGYKKCEYLGFKSGKDYDKFLCDCDIAINPQEPDESYMQFAFPSKIISYLGHNLITISTELNSIINSEFSNLVIFIKKPTPQKFAKAIESIDFSAPFNAIEKIKKADLAFQNDFKNFILNIKSEL